MKQVIKTISWQSREDSDGADYSGDRRGNVIGLIFGAIGSSKTKRWYETARCFSGIIRSH